jgi:hypothetical protein
MKGTLTYRCGLIAVLLLLSTELICPFSLQGTAHDAVAQSKSPLLSWNTLVGLFKRKKIRQGTRGNGCVITPDLTEKDLKFPEDKRAAKILNTKPLFVWLGNAGIISVDEIATGNEVWKKALTPQKWNIIYQGKELKLGVRYAWYLNDQRNDVLSVLSEIPFSIISNAERQKVQSDLMQIEALLRKKGNFSAETLALHRVQYFSQHELLSDALQEALSVKQPSRELSQFIQTIQSLAKESCEKAMKN